MDITAKPSEKPLKPTGGGTSIRRIILLTLLGALLATGVYFSPQFFIKEEHTLPTSHLKTGGTSVVSVIVENRWKGEYFKQKNVEVDYESTGSTAGVDRMIQKQLSIAFTHAPMSNDNRTKAKDAGGEVLHVPILICGVVPIYNLPQINGKTPVNFTGEVLANIFLGNIRTWDHADLKAINKDLQLPPTPITVVHRQDSSGTTLIFTDYLAKASAKWREKFPRGASEIQWPSGIGASRNLNLAIQVSEKEGAIGYVDLLYTHLIELHIDYGAVQNADKTAFLRADRESMTAAAQGAIPEIREDLTFDVANKPGPKSYPISGVIYAICYQNQPEPTRAHVVDFLQWANHTGQEFAEKMSYAPLPPELIERVDQRLKLIKPAP